MKKALLQSQVVKMKESENSSTPFNWRCSTTPNGKKDRKKKVSKGLSPQRFYNHNNSSDASQTNNNNNGVSKMQELKRTIQSSLIQQGKRRVGQEQTLRRAIYKQLTECKAWPLQDPALHHYHQLLQHHHNMQSKTPKDKSTGCLLPETIHVTHLDTLKTTTPLATASSASMSSSSGCFSELSDEPKRLLRTLHSSPAKNKYKDICRDEFLREQRIPHGLSFLELKENSEEEETRIHLKELLGRPAIWSMEPCIWAWEISDTGKRKYIVGHLGRCLDMYWRKTLPENRHGYELIRENVPCRLYLDIEYSKACNKHLDEQEASQCFLTALLEDLSKELQRCFPSQFSGTPLERKHVIDLDSSTDKKYSRHWIVHLPGRYLFSSNRALGRFVHAWIGSLIQRYHQEARDENGAESNRLDPRISKFLMVHTKSPAELPADKSCQDHSPPKTCIIDLGVYTKNRLFRLLGSSKFGKPASAALRIASENEFPFPPNFGNNNFYKSAGQCAERNSESQPSLIPKKYSESIPELGAVQEYKATLDWTPHSEALAQTLVIPMNSTKICYPLLPDLSAMDGDFVSALKINVPIVGMDSKASQTYGPSPLPLLDVFVSTHLATRGGIQGSIRSWSAETRNQTDESLVLMTYFLSRNRYCENIRRHHKSNGVFWSIDFVTGKASQRCFDPDCRGFSSRPVPLPKYIRDHIFEYTSRQRQGQSDLNPLEDYDKDEEILSEAIRSLNLDDISSTSTISTGASLTVRAEIDTLSDDALLNAISANPELFP